MAYNPDIHHRRSIRLRDYDYSNGGAYFVTLCAFQRECLFGEVADEEMKLNDAGQLVTAIWDSLPQRYQGLEVDAFVVMPNHLHGIIIINDSVGAIHESPSFESDVKTGAIRESPLQGRRRMLLSKVVGYLKMNAAKGINQLRNNPGVSVWQRVISNGHPSRAGMGRHSAIHCRQSGQMGRRRKPPSVGAIHESPNRT